MSETKKKHQANLRASADITKVYTKDNSTFPKKKINFICGDSRWSSESNPGDDDCMFVGPGLSR